ncbi:MAG: M4 family metallopeptidase [Actinomycetes bacterium]
MHLTSRPRSSVAALSVAAIAAAVVLSPTAVNAAASATGRVFAVNPVQSTGDESLTDQKDSGRAVSSSAYVTRALTNLDGSGYLVGDWANVQSSTGPLAYSPDGHFDYTRHDDRFEQVMAYFWVTEAQKYIQSLGFGTGELPAVNKESQNVRINQYGVDNSFSDSTKDEIRLGKGGVDDAEDGEVIVHEYGHAAQDAQVTGFGSSLDAGSIGEAFGDYLAVTVGLAAFGAPAHGVPAACVADWDSVSYTSTVPHCLRRVDTSLTVSQRHGEVHYDGQIWSRALWDIRTALGARAADRIIINAQFGFAPDTSFAAAARTTVATAQSMYGTSAAKAVQKAFAARGIL